MAQESASAWTFAILADRRANLPTTGWMNPYQRVVCRWCDAQNTNATNCALRGAPLDRRNLVTESG